MPRARRYFHSGLIWHITHRCHKKEFLLKFAKDRRTYIGWLYQAKRRYKIKILNYMITSNHIHLIILSREDSGHSNIISRSIQLIAGRTAQEYNQRKNRRGAFWEDRYHATVVDSGLYFEQCMTYVDLNMVRTGVVNHPRQWVHCGYSELISRRERYTVLDTRSLLQLFSFNNLKDLIDYRQWVIENAVKTDLYLKRDKKWTESVAVGSPSFLEKIKKGSGIKARARRIERRGDLHILHEAKARYKPYFTPENAL